MTRIVKLKEHHDVLVGQDLGKILEDGMIYAVSDLMGVLTLVPIGYSAHTMVAKERFKTNKSDPRTKSQLLMDGTTYITEQEYKAESKHHESEY